MSARPSTVIRVDVPAQGQSLQFLRVAAAAAGAEVIDDVDRLDDVRLVVDELAVGVIHAAPPGRRLQVTIETSPGTLAIQGRVEAGDEVPKLSDVGAMLVSSVCRSHRLAREADELVFELVVDDLPG